MFNQPFFRISIAALLAFLPAASAIAATATANLTVTATVVPSCSINAATLAFGSYDPTASGDVDASANVQVSCTKGTSATVGLNLGANASGSTRRMIHGSEYLSYELYQESGRSTVWGTTGSALLSLSAASSNAAQTVTVYGRLTSGQNVGTGSFSDTVVMTVTF